MTRKWSGSRTASRSADAFKDGARSRAELYVSLAGQKTQFLGYHDAESESSILALIRESGAVDEIEAGQAVEVILDRTPFYGESGGQIGDKGTVAPKPA